MISSEQADLIFDEVIKSKAKFSDLSEEELSKLTDLSEEELSKCAGGGKTIVVEKTTVVTHKERPEHSSEPMPAIGVAALGGGLTLIGTAIAAAGIVKGVKKRLV